MNKIFQNTVIIVLALISFKSVFAQSLNVSDLKPGEIYYAEYDYEDCKVVLGSPPCKYKENVRGTVIFRLAEANNCIFKRTSFIRISHLNSGDISEFGGFDGINGTSVCPKFIRKASNEEQHWLEVCEEQKKDISKEDALKVTSSKNRGEIKVAQISLNPADRTSPGFKGSKNGFCFSPVYFNYQFVNCGGEVQMGVNIYTNPQANYQKHTTSNGYMFEGEHYVTVNSSTNQVDIQEVEADLYFGSQRLGKVNLNYIVGNFTGCYGETFEVLKNVGKDPALKEYRENLDKFELKNIKILRGDLKISDKERENIHKSLKYDALGNPRNPNTKPAQNVKKEYDAFGNEIKSNNSGNTQKKYDAFGNPIKN